MVLNSCLAENFTLSFLISELLLLNLTLTTGDGKDVLYFGYGSSSSRIIIGPSVT